MFLQLVISKKKTALPMAKPFSLSRFSALWLCRAQKTTPGCLDMDIRGAILNNAGEKTFLINYCLSISANFPGSTPVIPGERYSQPAKWYYFSGIPAFR